MATLPRTRPIAMEVQAQYPSSAGPFTPRKPPFLSDTGAIPFFHINDTVAQLSNMPGAFAPQHQAFLDGDAVFSGEPESQLTFNATGSRKRSFLEGSVAHPTILQRQKKTRLAPVPQDVAPLVKAPPADAPCAGGRSPSLLPVSDDQIRLNDSAMTSTSGRPRHEAPLPAAMQPAISPLMEELASQLCHQNLEIEAFIRLQNERMRSGLEDARKRHHRVLLSVMEQGVLLRLRDKEAELDSARRRNAELEDEIQRLATENQVWSNVARNNEAIVSSLRATLDQVLFLNADAELGGAAPILFAGSPQQPKADEENECAAPVFPADDAQSCCHEGAAAASAEAMAAREVGLRSACRVCKRREASVLLMPCQHLCLCVMCDPAVDACPVCDGAKDASLEVLMC